jgi:GT2 family glycosyltransferase
MESVMNNLPDNNWNVYMSHNLPIPDCFNEPMKEAMNTDGDVWIVEEDMLIPTGTLKRMYEMGKPVVSVDYADRRTGKSLTWRDKKGNVILTGLGCMLVKREVFEKMEAPYFRRAIIEIQEDGSFKERVGAKTDSSYGTQDVYFCMKIREAGYEIDLLPNAKVGHMMVEEYGEDYKNNGVHKIKTVYL